MIVSDLDLGEKASGAASRAAAEAQTALAVGETNLAREKFREAGEILEKRIRERRKQPEKQLLRFLAASQYYQGGHYQKALELARRIESRYLLPETRSLFETFFRDAKGRADARYEGGVQQRIEDCWNQQQYEQVLTLLQEHPYVLKQEVMAAERALCCEHLKDYEAAAAFFSDAMRFAPDQPTPYFISAAFSIQLVLEGKLLEAWKAAECQLKEVPHALTYAIASMVRYHQGSRAETETEQRRHWEEQLELVHEARSRLEQLPAQFRNHPDLREAMTVCFRFTVFGMHRLGLRQDALAFADWAIGFNPTSPLPWTARATITYPAPQAITDATEAVRLGERNWLLFYFLACDALERRDFVATSEWCRRTLQHNPSPRFRAQMLATLGLCGIRLGSSEQEIHDLFRHAIEYDPDSDWIRRNYQVFQTSTAAPAAAEYQLTQPSWEDTWESGQDSPNASEHRIAERKGRAEKELVGV